MFSAWIAEKTLDDIRESTNKALVLGDDRFKRKLEQQLTRLIAPEARGRDRKSDAFRKTEMVSSAPVAITVNAAPTVAITAPTNNTVVTAPATITLTAAAADSDGTIAKVEFFQGAILIGNATAAPYTFTWSNVVAGNYVITAVATDNRGAATASSAVTLRVNALPTVSVTTPTAGASYTAPATIPLTANAADSDGTVAKVEYFQGGTLIGTTTAAPYTFTWANVAAGNYLITAQVTDNLGATAVSGAVAISINALPTVSLTAPANNALYTAPASITLTANAADADGTVAKVEFYQGATLIGTATSAPYSISWTNVAAGTYSLSAVATDNRGASTTSAAVAIRVNAVPTVSLTSPANNATFTAPASILLTANATDSDGTIAKVEFYQGATLLATLTSAPYTFNWTNVAAGSYTLSAKVTDNLNATGASAPVTVTVNAAPTVSLTSPATSATFTAPADIPLAANAADSDGTIAKVEFYHGSTLITTLTAAPYSVIWTGVPQGTYALTAKATDSQGATTTSVAVNVTVNTGVAQLYFIHTDHLNTPRAIYNQAAQAVWRWDNIDPFGGNPPDENPSGLGNFTCNLRLPGQYFDKETNLHYNYFRDYDPSIGRYIQSDPIGLRGGINTYLYVQGNPLTKIDPLGLAPWYGNYCGPGNNAPQLPKNCVDRACKIHDECYSRCSLSAENRWFPPELWSACAARCDAELTKNFIACRNPTMCP